MKNTDDSPTLRLPGILHGGDYNPEQWPASVWDEDMRLMREANVNVATLPVFGWVSLQPTEDTFTFEWLDTVLDKMAASGIGACMATATASVPAWLTRKYPDVLMVNDRGVRQRQGERHTFCPTSPDFRRLSTGLARRIAERYKGHPALLLWHVGNEYGGNDTGARCYCDRCVAAFRDWLRARYGTLETLNQNWYTAFWGHTYTDWAEVDPPYANGERNHQPLRLDWARFQDEALLDCYKAEAAVLRDVTPGVPITTNLMGTFYPLNYHRWAKELDVVSWDNYPRPDDPPANLAFSHTLMRGLKAGAPPFLLMEQSPSQQNWQPYNWLKAPGLLRLQSFQAIANGADSVMYFQWRRGRGGIEKLHGAIVEHTGRSDVRVFQEVSALGADLKRLGRQTLGGRVPARVALLFDWENWWGLSFSSGPSRDLNYVAECQAAFAALYALGIPTDIVAPGADLSAYDVILAPVLTLVRAEDAARIEARVVQGATFLATFFSGLVDENDLVHEGGAPGPLRRLLGLWTEETDALPAGKENGLRFARPLGEIAEGAAFTARLLCDRVRPEGAEPVAVYTANFYAGEPALTVNRFGEGRAYYLATPPGAAGLKAILQAVCAERGIGSPLAGGAPPPEGVEVTVRVSPEGAELLYLLNHNTQPVTVALAPGAYTDLLTGEAWSGNISLEARGVRVLKR